MTTRFTVEVLINAIDKASPVFKSFKRGFTDAIGIPKDFEEASRRLGAGLGGIAQQLPRIIIETTKLGIASQATTMRFERFAGSQEKAQELLGAFNRAADGTVDKMTAMAGTSKLLQLGVVETSDELETMAAIAVRLGDQTTDASGRIADFGALLANQSIPRLDNFGISSGKVRARIKELQAATEDLSREEAFKIAVMEQGRLSLEKLGDTSETTAFKMAKITAAVTDFRIEVGEELADALGETAGDVDALAAGIRFLGEPVGELLAAVGNVTLAFGGFRSMLQAVQILGAEQTETIEQQEEAFTGLALASDATMDALNQQIESQDSLESTILEAIEEIEREERAFEGVSFASDGAMGALNAQVQSQDFLEQTILETIKAIEAETLALNDAAIAQAGLNQSLMDATAAQIASAAIRELDDLLKEGKITTEDYRLAVTETQLAFGLADQASINLTDRMLALNEKFAEGTITSEEYDNELERLIQLNATENLQLEKFGEILSANIGTTSEAENILGTYDETLERTNASVRDSQTVIEAQKAALVRAGSAAGAAAGDIRDVGDSVRGLPDAKTITIRINTIRSETTRRRFEDPREGGAGPGSFQHGTAFAPGGVAMVHRNELMFVPRGAAIFPPDVSRHMTQNFTMNVNSAGQPGAAIRDFATMEALAGR